MRRGLFLAVERQCSVHLFATRGGRRQRKRGERVLLVTQAVERLACSCEGARRCSRGRRPAVPSGLQELLTCPARNATRTGALHSAQPVIIRRRRGARATRRPPSAPPRRPPRRGRFRNRGAASFGIVGVCRRLAAAAFPLPQLSKERHRGPSLRGGGRRPAQGLDRVPRFGRRPARRVCFLRGFFAGRRDDGAAGAGAGASREASVGGAGAAAPERCDSASRRRRRGVVREIPRLICRC